jgi:ElaB/YqjD/DUF883 family membrane-anchored ribosome-binding protein
MTEQEQRAEIKELRAELSGTVEELAHRADVPARARAKKDETMQRGREWVAQARAWVEQNPLPAAAAAAALAALLVGTLRGRSQPNR